MGLFFLACQNKWDIPSFYLVSFVTIEQAYSTTTCKGRTLNLLNRVQPPLMRRTPPKIDEQ